jgi:hypothetical protein
MVRGVRRGLDYTPLFQFLLGKVGEPWDSTFSEAVARLDRKEPIFWMVAPCRKQAREYVRLNESTYYSGLYIDEWGILRKTAPELGPESLEPSCACCTHTFNGVPFVKRFRLPESRPKRGRAIALAGTLGKRWRSRGD